MREEFQRDFAAERYACLQADAKPPPLPSQTDSSSFSEPQRETKTTTLLTTEQRHLRAKHRKAKAYAW